MLKHHFWRSGLIAAGAMICLGLTISVARAGHDIQETTGNAAPAAVPETPGPAAASHSRVRPGPSADAYHMTTEEFNRLVSQGHSPADVAEAAELARMYGINVLEMLVQHEAGESWEVIEQASLEQWIDRMENPPADLRPLATQTGLSQQEIQDLVDDGIPPEQISYAGSLAALFGLDPRAILERVRAGETVQQAARGVEEQAPPSQAKAMLNSASLEGTRAVVRPEPLSDSELAQLAAQGCDPTDLAKMSDLAIHLGVDPRDVVSTKKPNQTWLQAVTALVDFRRHGAKGGVGQ